MLTKDIKTFSDGITIIGGYPQCEVDIRGNEILITTLSSKMLHNNAVAKMIRERFLMPEDEYILTRVFLRRKGLRFRFVRQQKSSNQIGELRGNYAD